MILDRIWTRHAEQPVPAAPPAVLAPPSDTVQLAADDDMAAYQKKKRFLTDLTLLAAGDVPAMISIGANFGWLPIPSPLLAPLNAFNAMTGALGLASDLSVVRDCVNNPDVSLKDKIVDIAHLGNDFINTGASMVPLFMSIPGPLSVAGMIFAGGQVLGALGDGAKLLWDKHRGGEQSASADANEPRRLVMDRFEKRMGQIPMLLGCLGSQSLLAPTTAIPAALAGTMVTFGGAFGVVYGFTQVRKSTQLLKELEKMKAQGVTRFSLPQWTGSGLKTRSMRMDTAITRVNRTKWLGAGQMAASGALIAAGCLGMPALLVTAIAASTVLGAATMISEMHGKHRHLRHRIRHAKGAVQDRVHDGRERLEHDLIRVKDALTGHDEQPKKTA
ncbi:MAG: hypothetical protein FJX76_19550 [Armatimonadetes bacterium]|nr:hypothetical protein [Armatimonadota bacterium]